MLKFLNFHAKRMLLNVYSTSWIYLSLIWYSNTMWPADTHAVPPEIFSFFEYLKKIPSLIRAPQKALAKFSHPQKFQNWQFQTPKKFCDDPWRHFNSRVLPREHLLSREGEFVWCPVMLTRLSDKINCHHGTSRSRVPLLKLGKTSDAWLWNWHIKVLFF